MLSNTFKDFMSQGGIKDLNRAWALFKPRTLFWSNSSIPDLSWHYSKMSSLTHNQTKHTDTALQNETKNTFSDLNHKDFISYTCIASLDI